MSATPRCLYCGNTEPPDAERAQRIGVDHLVPRSRGGRDIPENTVQACFGCNVRKNDRLPSEWRDDLPPEVYELEQRALVLHPGVAFKEKTIQVALRIPVSLFVRLDKAAERMSQPGLRITRTEILRIATFRGIKEIETEQREEEL